MEHKEKIGEKEYIVVTDVTTEDEAEDSKERVDIDIIDADENPDGEVD